MNGDEPRPSNGEVGATAEVSAVEYVCNAFAVNVIEAVRYDAERKVKVIEPALLMKLDMVVQMSGETIPVIFPMPKQFAADLRDALTKLLAEMEEVRG